MRAAVLLFFVAIITCTNARAAFNMGRDTITSRPAQKVNNSILAQKIFPFFLSITNNAGSSSLLKRDALLHKITAAQQRRWKLALRSCGNVDCLADSLKWNDQERLQAGNRLQELYRRSPIFQKLISRLRSNHLYAEEETDHDTVFLRTAWNTSVMAVNYIFDTYLAGKPPVYVKIDSISFEKNDPGFDANFRNEVARTINTPEDIKGLFWTRSVNTALALLHLNGRDEAARYEPLNGGYNNAAFAKISQIKWKQFAYSMILIPGLGPEKPGVSLDPGGIKRCIAGAAEYRKGLAPFIVVSGGHVHPFKTPFNEAVEMKKYLVNELGIPGNAVFIEPHARHTTTNLRNANRMVYRFALDSAKPVLIVTDSSQAAYITGGMAKTAMRDLGFLPYRNVTLIGSGRVAYYPVIQSLRINPKDPLDP